MSIIETSRKYEGSQTYYLQTRDKLLEYENNYGVELSISKELIDDVIQRLKDQLSTFFTSIGHLQTDDNSPTDFQISEELNRELEISNITARKIQLNGIIEVGYRLWANLKSITANPYLHTDELLARLTEFGRKLTLVGSKQVENEDVNRLISTYEDIANDLSILKTQILAERKRKVIKSLFWPLVAFGSTFIAIFNIISGMVDIKAVIFFVVFSVIVIISVFAGLLGSILCSFEMNKKSATIRFLLSFIIIPIAILIFMSYGDFVKGMLPSLERVMYGLTGGLLLALFIATSLFEEGEKKYEDTLIKKAINRAQRNIFNRITS